MEIEKFLKTKAENAVNGISDQKDIDLYIIYLLRHCKFSDAKVFIDDIIRIFGRDFPLIQNREKLVQQFIDTYDHNNSFQSHITRRHLV